ncbi:SLC13 family permease [Plastorhodobacter daqingensis]|uniref:SLC13 family permease n=1 Tax=Plastorhodobacter daqingensis TaxID=1387281 RepID=A0ABW2UPX5_9RHOB
MTREQIILFAIFGALLVMFIWGRYRYDLVAFSGLLAGVVLGVVPADEAFTGFGHPATVIVALVLIVSAGITRSGGVQLITKRLVSSDRGVNAHIAIMGALGAVMSGFMNNIAALALLMPVDAQTARKARRAVGYTLMPLSFATILGGMITLIGTPPNILVATFRQQALGSPFRMFDFAPVGLTIAAAGLLFIATIGWRLIPVRGGTAQAPSALIDDYVAELVVPEGSDLIGRAVHELEPEADRCDVAILSLYREGAPRYGPVRNAILAEGDVLVVEAGPEALNEFRSLVRLDYPKNASKTEGQITGEGMNLIEVVVTNDSRINGKTAQALGLGWRHQTILMGISREGKTMRDRVRRTVILPGDILLLLVPEETQGDVVTWLGGLPLASGTAVTNENRVWWGLGLFVLAIAAVSASLMTMPVALGFVIVGYVLCKVLTLQNLYTHVDWPVIVLLGSMIPLGLALDATGGSAVIASALLMLTSGQAAWVSLLLLMVVTMFLSDVLNNNATTIIAAPVGIRVAEQLDVSADPFLMAVAVAASCAFLTPIGHQNNTVILGPGGYRFSDYWRMGLPLEVIVLLAGVPAILLFWPL